MSVLNQLLNCFVRECVATIGFNDSVIPVKAKKVSFNFCFHCGEKAALVLNIESL